MLRSTDTCLWTVDVSIGINTVLAVGCTLAHCFCELETHTHTQPFNGLWFGTTRVGRYKKKHSPTDTHPDHRTSFIIFLHLQQSMASSLFILRAWQSSLTTSLQVLFGLPLGLGPSTSYSIHFFTQSWSTFRSKCPYLGSLFCCSMQHTAWHTTTVQPSSHNQRHVLIGKQWY